MATNGFEDSGKEDGVSMGSVQEVTPISSQQAELEEAERKARVNTTWEQMNKGVSFRRPENFTNKPSSKASKIAQKAPPSWMTVLGLAPKKVTSNSQDLPQKSANAQQNGTSYEAKKLAAIALSAVKDSSVAAAALATSRGKVEVTEVRDFAGQEVEVKRFIDADSKEAVEKAKASIGPASVVDAVLEQIKKKPKLSVLDKTRKDWGEFKDENKGLEEELESYKKSSNQYTGKVSFLQRADLREFERERDARLALQSKRKATDL